MPKKQLPKNKPAKKNIAGLATKDIIMLNTWAHEGSKEAVEKLEKFIAETDDKELRAWAEMALDEAEYFYYGPDSEKEEQEFLLARMIQDKEDKLWEKAWKVDAAKLELQELDMDRKVHAKIIKNLKDKNKQADWQYNFSEDYYQLVKNRLNELEDEIAYEAAWLDEAQKLITLEKYKNIPADIFKHLHLDGDGCSFWEDDIGGVTADENIYEDVDNQPGANINLANSIKDEDIPF